MTPFQIMAVTICLVINMLDGFDVLAISFTAPEIAREWSVAPTTLGVLFSAGLAGMVLGALFIAPLADRYGRRPTIMVCLIVISAGMLASAATQSVTQLAAMRVLTGLGVGGMLASLNTMVAEYSSDRRRQFAISVLQVGYPVGSIIAGAVAAYLIPAFGWRAVFIVGGALSALMLPMVVWRLPESLDFLLSRRTPDSLSRANDLLRRLGHEALSELPEAATAPAVGSSRVTDVFSEQLRVKTISIWICYFMVMFCWYFAVNWTPKILVDAGLSLEQGISGGLLLNIGGVIGALLLGALASRLRINRLVSIYMALGAAAMMAFGFAGAGLALPMSVAFLIGFFVVGSMVGLYTIVPEIYPAALRTTGTGWAIGVGRFGAVAGPYLAGLLIAQGWERPQYYFVLALPLFISMIAVMRLRARPAL
jgi:benzoate transport